MNSEQLTTLRNQMTEKWFSSLKVGDKVYNYSLKWQNKQIIDKKLIFDEFGYIVTPGVSVMPAQGRSLSFSICFELLFGYEKFATYEASSFISLPLNISL